IFFFYFRDEHNAEDAIHALDNSPFGYDRRRLFVEWEGVSMVGTEMGPSQWKTRDQLKRCL
nr:serine/arginine-rich splicing factor RS31-like [Tanacetum cinerariifolium]